jgi:peptidoglycan hydrolase CwlO-like protein
MKIIKEEKNLTDMLSDLQEKLIITEKELDTSRNQLESLKQEIETNNNELREFVSVIDSRVRIS